jgi:hypothetical protein
MYRHGIDNVEIIDSVPARPSADDPGALIAPVASSHAALRH